MVCGALEIVEEIFVPWLRVGCVMAVIWDDVALISPIFI